MNILLKSKMLEDGISQIALAKQLKITDSMLSKVINQWRIPTTELKRKIAKILNCKVKDLF